MQLFLKLFCQRSLKLTRQGRNEGRIEGFKLTHLEQQQGCKFSGNPEDARPIWRTNSRCKNRKQSQI